MRTYCKNVDITDTSLIVKAIREVLVATANRRKFFAYASKLCTYTRDEVMEAYRDNDRLFDSIVRAVAVRLGQTINDRELKLHPITRYTIFDDISNKDRVIGCQDIESKIIDHAVVLALEPLFKTIGEYQYASIKGRGPYKGAKRISEWLRNKKMKYWSKVDVKQCYAHIKPALVYSLIAKRVKNPGILYVLSCILEQHGEGLSIGSYLSQWLCNYTMSFAYHYVREELFSVRRGRKLMHVKHAVFYMDDLLLIGTNKRHIESATKKLEAYLKIHLDLTVKQWHVYNLDQEQHLRPGFIDMLGYRCHRRFLTIRRKTWRKLRRAYLRAAASYVVPLRLARRVLSYYGYIKNAGKHLERRVFKYKYITEAIRKSKLSVSQHTKKYANLASA